MLTVLHELALWIAVAVILVSVWIFHTPVGMFLTVLFVVWYWAKSNAQSRKRHE